MTPPQPARVLAPFGLRPANIRMGSDVVKSYTEAAFADVRARYLPQAGNPEAPLSAREGGLISLCRYSIAHTTEITKTVRLRPLAL